MSRRGSQLPSTCFSARAGRPSRQATSAEAAASRRKLLRPMTAIREAASLSATALLAPRPACENAEYPKIRPSRASFASEPCGGQATSSSKCHSAAKQKCQTCACVKSVGPRPGPAWEMCEADTDHAEA